MVLSYSSVLQIGELFLLSRKKLQLLAIVEGLENRYASELYLH